MACLDTTVFIDLGGRGGKANAASAHGVIADLIAEEGAVATTRVNVAEVLVGVARSKDPVREKARVDRFLAGVAILELDAAAAEHFGRIKAALLSRGTPVGDLDLLVAAIALTHDHTLVTRNPRHFLVVPGLRVRPY